MKEWKHRRMIYYSIAEQENECIPHIIECSRQVTLNRIVDYFKKYDDSGTLYYPSKSYAVAIIYADLLRKNFGGDFYSYLKDPELLDRDHHFVAYAEDSVAYDFALCMIDQDNINYTLPNTAATKKYFEEEFLLGDHRSLFEDRV